MGTYAEGNDTCVVVQKGGTAHHCSRQNSRQTAQSWPPWRPHPCPQPGPRNWPSLRDLHLKGFRLAKRSAKAADCIGGQSTDDGENACDQFDSRLSKHLLIHIHNHSSFTTVSLSCSVHSLLWPGLMRSGSPASPYFCIGHILRQDLSSVFLPQSKSKRNTRDVL